MDLTRDPAESFKRKRAGSGAAKVAQTDRWAGTEVAEWRRTSVLSQTAAEVAALPSAYDCGFGGRDGPGAASLPETTTGESRGWSWQQHPQSARNGAVRKMPSAGNSARPGTWQQGPVTPGGNVRGRRAEKMSGK